MNTRRSRFRRPSTITGTGTGTRSCSSHLILQPVWTGVGVIIQLQSYRLWSRIWLSMLQRKFSTGWCRCLMMLYSTGWLRTGMKKDNVEEEAEWSWTIDPVWSSFMVHTLNYRYRFVPKLVFSPDTGYRTYNFIMYTGTSSIWIIRIWIPDIGLNIRLWIFLTGPKKSLSRRLKDTGRPCQK